MSVISPPQRPRRNVALIVSVCVNLLLAGVVAVGVLRFIDYRQQAPIGCGPMSQPVERQQVRQILMSRLMIRVAPEKRDAIRAIGHTHHDEIDALRDATLVARREVVRLYSAPVIDQPAFNKALARMQVADAALEVASLKAASEAVVLLSADERKAVLAWQPPHGFHGGGGWHGQDIDNGGSSPQGQEPSPPKH